jgi:hypothetical protein
VQGNKPSQFTKRFSKTSIGPRPLELNALRRLLMGICGIAVLVTVFYQCGTAVLVTVFSIKGLFPR